ncbi:hypothetical protein CEUSTIGMA_g5602.t1 [Chlamydomonas eustigma]|uniref:ABC transporter domain-containing protein n=1 Tax=Chlamydomonas eustigma TaxID=1157962 RepID=A0A250X5X7_9CHLO|nr:hypothetical protein CEUSTIGMA_g5602.t1 [Chlamydomonas eustigma]|eukprot:GAX78160.1 hypothetical protein CEUSTIGMA_g5602.t1 [Chlamydomonas eustigma]
MAKKPLIHSVSSPFNRRHLYAIAVIAGGITIGGRVCMAIRNAQREQKLLLPDSSGISKTRKAVRIAVNMHFFSRLRVILGICVPGPFSREAMLILSQTVLLVFRTLLTDWISHIEGISGSTLVSLDFPAFGKSLVEFGLLGIPAAIVNSGLKYIQKKIEISFQSRLTEYLHKEYCKNRAYYAASNLGGMTSTDQRITEDVDKFCFCISDLYSHTFKPFLDVVLFTRSLSKVMGYRGQFALYGYYLIVAYVLRAISPPLAQMTSQEAALTGSLRAAHQRLVTYSEEVAYNDPPGGAAELMILNQHLRRLVKYSDLSAVQRFFQQIVDGYLVKYFASVTALLVYAAPIFFKDPKLRASQGELTRDYIRSMRLLQNTNRGIGDLVLVYKRVSNLASHTGRVSELLEQVRNLSEEDAEHKELFRRNVSATHMLGISSSTTEGSLPPCRITGDILRCHQVSLDSPDGTPLVRKLTFEVLPGKSCMIVGQNGCGKSSLFRVLSGLWPLQAGEVTCPPKANLFYLSQRPYLVSGTLRDQVLYPFPPHGVWLASAKEERVAYVSVAGRRPPEVVTQELDAELEACLQAVELEYLLTRGRGWDQVMNWQETLSGGEKQRLAMARLLYHRPSYAILDECTSAVSADGEVKLYEELQKAGITCLSIAHRSALRRFHSCILHFDGSLSKSGLGWSIEEVPPSDMTSMSAEDKKSND